MLTGEYFVLDGATALAFPTKKGQSLEFKIIDSKLAERSRSQVKWKSLDTYGNVWFETEIECVTLKLSNSNKVGQKLEQILRKARELNPEFLRKGGEVEVKSDFNLQWGFGSSSTLVSLIAQWAQVDPYKIQFESFGGSGYDIACAIAKGPIIYQKWPEPKATSIRMDFPFKDHLYFVYLGQKQDSREGIKHYRAMENAQKEETILKLNLITENIAKCDSLVTFCADLKRHEDLVANAIDTKTVQQRFFSDFDGQTKSLGAWGGDFILAASAWDKAEVEEYFNSKGFDTVLAFSETVL
ncbi:MAG: GHMP kinase [Bacteroidia bacterium]